MDIEDFIMTKSSFPFQLTLSSLKFWKKHSSSITINEGDSTQKVVYLGNVLTAWAKGDQSVNRALETLWTNFNRKNSKKNNDPIQMRLTIRNSGLKAETRQFGLTEYWANRITYCCWRNNYPKVFCWVYRHVGRRGKPELRCHAVLCQKEESAKRMARLLEQRLAMALREFLREKMLRQRARMSLMEIPVRKLLLVKGMANFRPPIERSRSAPRLVSIVEETEEEQEEEDEMIKLFQKQLDLEEEEDFAELSSISLGEEEEEEEDDDDLVRFVQSKLFALQNAKNRDDEDDENDSAIDSESFKSDEIVCNNRTSEIKSENGNES
ncbi:Protein FAM43A [Sarcoptes scabiei]|uniref:Protein FAM43A n=1 Tax=Sarcoptes scabiei TaxID=52283 RepID=A0A132A4Z8_SARSC|nr:Protein FAM43A [Sarcoptes scabiei]KPM05480.1 protein FAM43A-like protein [Sarcoptes scabiei]